MSSMPDESSVLAKSDHEGDNQNMEVVVETSENDITMNGEAEESSVTMATSRVLEYLQEAREEGGGKAANSSVFHGYRSHGREEEEEESQEGSHDSHPPQTNGRASPAASFSTPDDTPSVHVSAFAAGGWKLWANIKEPQGSVASSRASSAFGSRFSPSPSLRPFDRRFQSRLQPGALVQSLSPRALSPSPLSPHSRSSSFGNKTGDDNFGALDEGSAPWDIVRWTKLKKIKNQLFSEAGRRKFGSPTCITVSATIAVGTSKGSILIFDYNQKLQSIIGPGTKGMAPVIMQSNPI